MDKETEKIEGDDGRFAGVKAVYHIKLSGDESLFNEIQNIFGFYDNCVLDNNEKIIIETHLKKNAYAIAKSIEENYESAKPTVSELPASETILDKDEKIDDLETGEAVIGQKKV